MAFDKTAPIYPDHPAVSDDSKDWNHPLLILGTFSHYPQRVLAFVQPFALVFRELFMQACLRVGGTLERFDRNSEASLTIHADADGGCASEPF
jgi:hypothetical protein